MNLTTQENYFLLKTVYTVLISNLLQFKYLN